MAALLLELAAADDVVAFRRAVEEDKVSALDAACQWYGPSAAGARLRLELRTPAMVAALYGSTAVLAYVLSTAPAEAARASPTDGATPLHLTAAGGAAGAVTAVHLLTEGVSADTLTFLGLCAGDFLPHANATTERGTGSSVCCSSLLRCAVVLAQEVRLAAAGPGAKQVVSSQSHAPEPQD